MTAAARNVMPLDVQRVAVRLGVQQATVRKHLERSRRRADAGELLGLADFPLPDGAVSGAPFWWEPTIDAYLAHRRAPGGRRGPVDPVPVLDPLESRVWGAGGRS